MQRFYLPAAETAGDILTLTEREAHHALNVVRLRVGEVVQVLDGQGGRCTCQASELAKRTVQLQVIQRDQLPPRRWPVTLIQAVPKGKTFDTIVQKATELGAHRVIPLLTRRVVSQIDPDRHESKLDHWRAIGIESIKQCGSPWLPEITAPCDLAAALAAAGRPVVGMVASLRANARHPWPILQAGLAQSDGPIALWVGPEGDFTADELDAIEAAGAAPVSLGPLVLRADTAAIYGLSIINCAIESVAAPARTRDGTAFGAL